MKRNLIKFAALSAILALLGVLIGFLPVASAAGVLTSASDTLSRQKVSESANHYVKFTTATTGTIETYVIEFPNDFDLSSPTSPTLEIKVDGVDKSGDGAWAFDDTSDSKDAIWTYDSPIEVADSLVIELWFEDVGNPSGAASYTLTFTTKTSVPADIDTTTVKVQILTDEQVGVSGTVSQSISFSIEAPADLAIGFGTWTGTEIRYPTDDESGATEEPGAGLPIQLQVSTNASTGLTVSGKSQGDDTDPGLYKSTATTKLIPAVASTAVSADAEEYGVYVKEAGTGLTIDEGFDNDSDADEAITYTSTALATATAPLSAITMDVVSLAAITGTTPAGSYSDTLTFLCAGNF